MSQIKVTKIRSSIGQSEKVKKVVWSLGLRRIGQTKQFKDTNCIRGAVNKARHLLRYELVD